MISLNPSSTSPTTAAWTSPGARLCGANDFRRGMAVFAPSALLVFAGGFNGLILPIGFTILLYAAWRRRALLRGYSYPKWLLALGALVAALTWYMGITSARTIFEYLAG